MSKYINIETMEYPRHVGDILLDGNKEKFVKVLEVPAPIVPMYSYAYEDTPELIDGEWTQRWLVGTMTEEEIEQSKKFEELMKPKSPSEIHSL
jgi:hypothetical protein